MNRLKTYFKYYIPAIFLAGMFFSCENDLANVKVVTATEDTPDQIFTDFHMLYSDSGNVKIEILGAKVEDYSKFGRVSKFKNGIVVNYYSDSATLVSRLSAEYAELKPLENMIIAKNNVIITNFEKQQTLKTEELYYDKRIKKIRTDKPFYIESPNTKANGVGLVADETFSNYTMSNFSLIYTDTTKNEFSTIK